MKKRIAILGSTGSIGTQTLDVIRANPTLFEVEALVAYNNFSLLIEQAFEFKPNHIVIVNEAHYQKVCDALSREDIKIFAGINAVNQLVALESIDIVLTAMVGYAGLEPTINAIKAGKQIALANKETLVVAGELIQSLTMEHKVNIYPVDSEHSAIFQCLVGEMHNEIEKIFLTASGGPFRNFTIKELERVTKKDALKHPNWNMGNKITIDSASLVNKGLEAIEARWLFDLLPNQIDVIVHPQSIIHSIVQFTDGSMKAQMGMPDMRLPIQYALTYPNRIYSALPRFSFVDYPTLTFEKPDTTRFPAFALAMEALNKCGNMPCILNAANEIAVDAFLNERIFFTDIPRIIENAMNKVCYIKKPSYEQLLLTDSESRKVALEII